MGLCNLQTSRSLAMSQAAYAVSPTLTSNWWIEVCQVRRPRRRFHSSLTSGQWPVWVLTARRSASCTATDPCRWHTWPNMEICLFWILSQMLSALWLITITIVYQVQWECLPQAAWIPPAYSLLISVSSPATHCSIQTISSDTTVNQISLHPFRKMIKRQKTPV